MFRRFFFSFIVVFLVFVSSCLVQAQIRANAGPDQRVHPGEEVTLDGSASTVPEGVTVTYNWKGQTPCTEVPLTLPVTDQPVIKFTAPAIPPSCGDSYFFYFTLTLSSGGSTYADSARVIVVPQVNQPPVAEAGPDQIVFDRLVLDGSGSKDPEGGVLEYLWEVDSGEEGAHVPLAAGSPVEVDGQLLQAYIGKIVKVVLTVKDPYGASSSDTMLLAVAGPVPVPKLEPVEPDAEISLHHFNISQFGRWDKKAVGFHGAIEMPEDLQDLNLDKGDVVDARVTIELFDLPEEGETFIASGEALLKVKKWRNTLLLEMMRQHTAK
jgi:hypothetical protein